MVGAPRPPGLGRVPISERVAGIRLGPQAGRLTGWKRSSGSSRPLSTLVTRVLIAYAAPATLVNAEFTHGLRPAKDLIPASGAPEDAIVGGHRVDAERLGVDAASLGQPGRRDADPFGFVALPRCARR